MTSKIYIIVLVCCFNFSFHSKKEPKFIIPGVGIDSIEVNNSNYRQMRQILGKGELEKIYLSCAAESSYYYEVLFKKFDVQAFFHYSRKIRKNDILNTISIRKNSNLRTKEGIGIGSTRKDVQEVFGIDPITVNKVGTDSAYYLTIAYQGISFIFRSKFERAADSMNLKVHCINIFN